MTQTDSTKKIQVFNLKVTEPEMNEMINMFMEFPAGRVYILLKKIETQSVIQRNFPDKDKEWEPVIEKKGP